MTLRSRLGKIEQVLAGLQAEQHPQAACHRDPRAEDWLAYFEERGRRGDFAEERDFPTALTFYRDAITQAKAEGGFDAPADDFQPYLASDPHLRLHLWRLDRGRFPGVWQAWEWLAEMAHRAEDGTPPVTETEFRELAAWFTEHRARLHHRAGAGQMPDLDDGRSVSVANVYHGLTLGPRSRRAGEVAEDVRRIRARYGDPVPEAAAP